MISRRPRLLDLFCGAGGAAVGYHRAGFDVVGVDIALQKRYPFEFVQADAMTFPLDGFDCVHASPPCQRYSIANNIHGKEHPDLLGPIRDRLIVNGKPWVIENVPGAPMHVPAVVCGLALGLGVRRHRLFESDAVLFGTGCGDHSRDYVVVFGGGGRGRTKQIGRTNNNGPILRRPTIPVDRCREAMGISWMTRAELSQAIPPTYTCFIGKQLIRRIG